MADTWEKLKGKPTRIQRLNSSLPLKRMRRYAPTENEEKRGHQILIVPFITCLLSMGWVMRTGFASGKVGIICFINSVRRMPIGFIGDTAIAKIWCIGVICLRRCIPILNCIASADSASWKMNGLSRSITAKCREIASLLRVIHSYSTGKSIQIILLFRMLRPTHTNNLIMFSTRVSGKKRTDTIQFQEHRLTVGSVNGADLPHTSFIQKTWHAGNISARCSSTMFSVIWVKTARCQISCLSETVSISCSSSAINVRRATTSVNTTEGRTSLRLNITVESTMARSVVGWSPAPLRR